MGLRIESKNVFSGPEYEVDFLSIPGRDGDLIADGGRFPNVQVTYSVFIPAKTISELSQKITAVKAWLYSGLNSYHTLSDTYDTAFFRHAVFAGKLDIEDELNRIGIFTISFSCKPFRYDAAGTESVTLATGEVLLNPYPFTSKPILRIEGSGKGTLTIQSEGSNAIWNFTSIDGYVEADSEQMNFYKDAEPKNDTVSGDGFPLLYPGENTVSFSGGITAVTVTPRWCCL
nr:MAG TPA: distal tail protein [Caudoviricetes sp.]